MHVGADTPRADTERGGDVMLAEIGEVTQHDDVSLASWKLAQRMAERETDRYGILDAQRSRRRRAWGLAAYHVERQVGDYPHHPGISIWQGPDPLPPGEGPGQGLGGDVIGLGAIGDQPEGDALRGGPQQRKSSTKAALQIFVMPPQSHNQSTYENRL